MFRIDPNLPVQAYKTYQVVAPLSTHFRPGTCKEADCAAQAHGWRTAVDENNELGRSQAHYIRKESGRAYIEDRTPEGLTVFTFAAGQQCFAQHRVSLERDPRYFVRDGDWRGNPYGTRPVEHVRPEDWVEDFAEHQQRISDRIERG